MGFFSPFAESPRILIHDFLVWKLGYLSIGVGDGRRRWYWHHFDLQYLRLCRFGQWLEHEAAFLAEVPPPACRSRTKAMNYPQSHCRTSSSHWLILLCLKHLKDEGRKTTLALTYYVTQHQKLHWRPWPWHSRDVTLVWRSPTQWHQLCHCFSSWLKVLLFLQNFAHHYSWDQ